MTEVDWGCLRLAPANPGASSRDLDAESERVPYGAVFVAPGRAEAGLDAAGERPDLAVCPRGAGAAMTSNFIYGYQCLDDQEQ
jgi:hypothetical protein